MPLKALSGQPRQTPQERPGRPGAAAPTRDGRRAASAMTDIDGRRPDMKKTVVMPFDVYVVYEPLRRVYCSVPEWNFMLA